MFMAKACGRWKRSEEKRERDERDSGARSMATESVMLWRLCRHFRWR